MSVVIIDYGIGNIRSIFNAFESQKSEVVLSRERETILNADGLVLPGVGSFAQGMKNLKKYGLVDIIKDFVITEKPFLGICLGMQMLLEESEEFGTTKGLGLIKGRVIKLPVDQSKKIKLPHISWNEITPKNIDWENTILDGISSNQDMYFVHSYTAAPEDTDEILSVTDYSNVRFCSSLKKKNIYGCQFHPEKSGEEGLSIIRNFINLTNLKSCQN